MAKPIKETPVLSGKDAKKFAVNISNEKIRKVSPEEIARIKENFGKVQAIAQR